MSKPLHLVLTYGEPAGIGPDLCLLLGLKDFPWRVTVVGDLAVLKERAAQLGLALLFRQGPAAYPQRAGELWVLPRQAKAQVIPGQPNPANARHVLEVLATAVSGCLEGQFDALVTAPVHKGIINAAGIPFRGHTEFIASLTSGQPVMLLQTSLREGLYLRVALATTHLPLREVPSAITCAKLSAVLKVLHHDLKLRFGIAEPRIAVLGLNPHAGEGGYLGREEIEVIEPVLKQLRAEGMALLGPLPADTAFLAERLHSTDAFLAMYHDQGLGVLKYAGFGRAVNLTLGLPIIRTSVDHGTALDLAGTGRADPSSLLEAVALAAQLALNRAKT
jgi:4-hydroxythreonine-4-phosphate dehydrogenase